jgi:hypothetical protein
MAAANIGYVPISEEETCNLMDERNNIKLAVNALQQQFSRVFPKSEEAIQSDAKITEQLQNLFSRHEAIDVTLCKAGRSQDPRRKIDIFSGIRFSDKVKELAGARYIPLTEANKIGQSGLPAMPAGFSEDFVPHVWVWPEGHPFIVRYIPLHLNPSVDTDEE